MGSIQTIKPETGLIKIPTDYPSYPTPDKLELLLNSNDKSLYHRYSPYAEYNNGSFIERLVNLGVKEPFIYDYIDEAKKGLSGLRKHESRLFPIGSAPRDVIRITKFLSSGKGISFLASQFLLQTTNTFNETRIYNPTSPIVAAGMGLTLGLISRPQRNIDLTGGLGGLARSLIGNTIPNLFGPPTVSPPFGTVGSQALATSNQNEGKGLLRAHTANNAQSRFISKWQSSGTKFGVTSFLSKIAKSLFGNFIPQTQSGISVRGDEGSYGIMIVNADRFKYYGSSGTEFQFGQKWVAGLTKQSGIRKNNQYTLQPYSILSNPDGTSFINKSSSGFSKTIPNLGTIGYDISSDSNNQLKPGVRYGDSVGNSVNSEYEASDIMMQYEYFTNEDKQFDSKKTDQKSVEKINGTLKNVISNLQKSGVYKLDVPRDSKTFSSGNSTVNGYTKIFNRIKENQPGRSPLQYGVIKDYLDQNIRMVDNSLTNDPVKNSLKLPGSKTFDAINTLTILPGKNSGNDKYIKYTTIPGWTQWDPYRDDQIAFFFYDLINDKYLPFRATIQGLNESSTSAWQELNFIGRADRLYSYGGFTRNLNFSFDVVISSIIELAPTWKRINYLMSLVKPARYTKAQDNYSFNRFLIPPMVEITIGDLYKRQPIIIQSLSMNIPDNAIWETLNEENVDNGEWNYLVNYIKSNKIRNDGKDFGQFPREAKLSIGCTLLEKERAIVGGANFGHAPHTDDYNPTDILEQPSIHRSLVEHQFDHAIITTEQEDKRTIQSPNVTGFHLEQVPESNTPPQPSPVIFTTPIQAPVSQNNTNVVDPRNIR